MTVRGSCAALIMTEQGPLPQSPLPSVCVERPVPGTLAGLHFNSESWCGLELPAGLHQKNAVVYSAALVFMFDFYSWRARLILYLR